MIQKKINMKPKEDNRPFKEQLMSGLKEVAEKRKARRSIKIL